MSKIMVEFDTKTKELMLFRNGLQLSIEGLQDVNFFANFEDPEKFHMSMSHFMEDEEDGTRTSLFISAEELAKVVNYVNI